MRTLKQCEARVSKDSVLKLWLKCISIPKPEWEHEKVFQCPSCGRKFRAVIVSHLDERLTRIDKQIWAQQMGGAS